MKQKLNKLQNKVLLLFMGIILLSTGISFSQNRLEILLGHEVNIKSKFLNEERVATVFLPANYDVSKQKYPVMYVLDARTHFQHATSAVNFLSRQGIISQIIIVAIHNIDRTRAFSPVHDERMPTSGGAEKFLNFVSCSCSKTMAFPLRFQEYLCDSLFQYQSHIHTLLF